MLIMWFCWVLKTTFSKNWLAWIAPKWHCLQGFIQNCTCTERPISKAPWSNKNEDYIESNSLPLLVWPPHFVISFSLLLFVILGGFIRIFLLLLLGFLHHLTEETHMYWNWKYTEYIGSLYFSYPNYIIMLNLHYVVHSTNVNTSPSLVSTVFITTVLLVWIPEVWS